MVSKFTCKCKLCRYTEVLVTSGLHDPRVAYWEGAKYAARLRDAAVEGGCSSRWGALYKLNPVDP
jgi:hypothetical protein